MKIVLSNISSFLLERIARFFVQTASPLGHQPEIPHELKS